MCKSPSRLNGLLVSTEARVSAGARVQNGAQLSKAKAQWTVSKGAVSRPPCLGPSPKALAFSLVTQPSFVSQYPNNSRDQGGRLQQNLLPGRHAGQGPGDWPPSLSTAHRPRESPFSALLRGGGAMPSVSPHSGLGSLRWHMANGLGVAPGAQKHPAAAKGKASAASKAVHVAGAVGPCTVSPR